jgi:hypothetical protein
MNTKCSLCGELSEVIFDKIYSANNVYSVEKVCMSCLNRINDSFFSTIQEIKSASSIARKIIEHNEKTKLREKS